jgi:hypothetical protein
MLRADWHTAPVEPGAEEDPFAPTSVEAVGVPIVLSAEGPHAALNDALLRSLVVEGELDEQGVRCHIKDSPETSCYACPLYRTDDSPLARLCAVGREQERAATMLLARRHGG